MELRELCGLDYVSLCAHEAGEESHEGKFVNTAVGMSKRWLEVSPESSSADGSFV